ncbi:hypothetical protein Celaphus_00003985, partial [Cervus elaphus hippelaphus]
NEHKRKIPKYDSSKYCHNLKKIGEDFTNAVPISNLTWELEGGNDPMSKKRQGEFSDFHSPAKKTIKVQRNEGPAASLTIRSKPRGVTESPHLKQQVAQETPHNSITPKSPSTTDDDDVTRRLQKTESNGQETTAKRDRASKSHRTPGDLRRGQQHSRPEEIVASLLEGKENPHGKQKPKENTLKSKFQAFKGVGCLHGKESMKKSLQESVASNNINKDQISLKLEEPKNMSMEKWSLCANGPSSEQTPFQHAKESNDSNQIQPQKTQSSFESQGHKAGVP